MYNNSILLFMTERHTCTEQVSSSINTDYNIILYYINETSAVIGICDIIFYPLTKLIVCLNVTLKVSLTILLVNFNMLFY